MSLRESLCHFQVVQSDKVTEKEHHPLAEALISPAPAPRAPRTLARWGEGGDPTSGLLGAALG